MNQKPRDKVLSISLNRRVPRAELQPFTEYFKGFEKVGAVRSVFGDETEEVLNRLKISFLPNRQMYMGIRDHDGNLSVGTYHLKNSSTVTLYLDVVHELFHIKQWMKDNEYFTREHLKFMQDRSLYYASPIEIPAYEHTVREAERIGMPREEIIEHLKMMDAPPKIWRNFLKEMKFSAGPVKKRITRFPVTIKRHTSPKLYRFTDYFRGFEKVPSVREILGDSTSDALGGIKVEFVDVPWPMIYPSEEDGHLLISREYLRKGSLSSIYLDTFLCLKLIKLFSEEAGSSTGSGWDLWSNPVALKAYSAMVAEARRLGMPDGEIMTHFALPSFLMSKSKYREFLKAIGLRPARR